MKSKKVILDTNLWISFLISKKLDYIDELLLKGKIRLVFSEELIEEFLTVIKRPKFKKYFTDENIKEILELFDSYGELINVSSKVEVCRDNKDNFLLSLAVDGKANYLVTGDDDLLTVKKIKKTKIVNWSKFIEEIK